MVDGNQINAEDLELGGSNVEPMPLNLKEVREEAERRAIIRALGHNNQNVSDAANALGITRPTLYNIMEKLGLKV
jgi:two-component system NtrC family response regulator